jgi:hypothetical protein
VLPSFSLVERRAPGGSFGRLPRLPPQRAAQHADQRLRSDPRRRPRQRQLNLPTSGAPDSTDATDAEHATGFAVGSPSALPTVHAAAAAEAVAALQLEKVRILNATAAAAASAKRLSASAAAAPSTKRHSNGGGSAEGLYVTAEAAQSKWPSLSPRSAVLKERTIARLAALPAQVVLQPECSYASTARMLGRRPLESP